MSLQILEILLYSKRGDVRVLSLRPGEMNIITGDSKTGKSALITIVDYCLAEEFGNKSFHELTKLIDENIGRWGGEFVRESLVREVAE